MTESAADNEYHVGGSLPVDASSYVTRKADSEFYKNLSLGEFCYILNSRQMGKSSLRVRTMQRLQAEGFICAFIDLTGIGKEDVTAEKWYAGIVQSLVSSCQLGKTINWRTWWRQRKDLLSPVQRFNLFIEEVLLVAIQQKIFIFVDEIDRVLSQSFCLDDFFALIRFFYNKRVDNPAYQRLTFALLGVATPSDLITDKTQTPFNIGKAIELHGFEFHEAQPLAKGLEGKVKNPQLVLQEILSWTGGQPFLTQKVCKLVAELGRRGNTGDTGEVWFSDINLSVSYFVERLVRQCIIENWEAQDEPEHLKTIRDRLLRNEQKAGRLLGIYQEILQSSLGDDEGVPADGSPEQTELRLSGLVVQQQGKLKVYNSIYQQVFNQNWVKKQLEKLRPYSQSFNVWVSSNFQDESRLLRGKALQDALSWANNQSLSTLDYRFLAASQDLEKREVQQSLAVKEEESLILARANNTLTQAQRQAKLIINIGSMILVVSLIAAVAAGVQLGIVRREQAEADVLLTSINSQRAFDKSPFQALLAALKAGHKLQNLENLFPAKPATRQQVMSALRQSIYSIRERNRLEGHQDRVKAVNFSPDGKILASASTDHTVKLWNAHNGILLATLKSHTENVLSVSFSPDGQMLASTGNDGTVKLWNVKSRTLIKSFKGHRDRIPSVSFSHNGKMLVCGGFDGTIGLINVDNGKLIRILTSNKEPVHSASFSPDGKLVATASFDHTLKLWRVFDGSLVKTLTGHRNKLASVSFSPNGKMVATASFDHTVKLWNVADGSLVQTLEDHIAPVKSVKFSPDGRFLASASEDGTMKLWNVKQEDIEPQTFAGHGGHIWDVSFSPDGQTLATASNDNTVRLWQVESIEPQVLAGHQGRVWNVSFSPDGKIIASASADQTIKLWYFEKSQPQTLIGHSADVRCVSFSPDGKMLASASDDSTIKLWRLSDRALLRTLNSHSDRLSRVSFSPDGNILATAGDDSVVTLWNVSDGKILQTLKGHGNRPTGSRFTSISFSPDGSILAAVSNRGEIKLWRVAGGSFIRTLKAHSDILTSVRFSPDGKLLASASADNTVKLWRIGDGTIVKTLNAHSNWVTSVSFNPNGKTLASASLDSTIKIWNISDGTLLQTFKAHRHWVTSIDFSPDEKILTSAGSDEMVKLWNVTLEIKDFMKLGCRWLRDYLAIHPEEREIQQICQN